MRELIVDSFAGGGGASTGIEMALGRSPDFAINHDADAIAVHAINHPGTVHLSRNIYTVDPMDVVGRRPVGLLWASPDCKHFSKAKGSKPVKRNIRDLAWTVVLWAKRVRPRVIILENVEEFQDWGPLIEPEPGCFVPCPERLGETFRRWVSELRRLGYRVEWRELRACDFGAPTTRKRLFVIARRDGRPIVWPEPTHGAPQNPLVVAGHLKPWRTAAEIIDWSLPCPSIFLSREQGRAIGVNRPLAEATMARIAKGVRRYVIEAGAPFIVPITHTQATPRVHPIDEPVRTITTASRGELAFVVPTLVQTGYGERQGQAPRALNIHAPLGTVVAGGVKHALVAPHLTKFRQNSVGVAMDEPAPTVTANSFVTRPGGAAPLGVVAAFLAQHNTGLVGHDAREPVSTIVSTGSTQAVVSAGLVNMRGADRRGGSVDAPVGTVTAGGTHVAEVRAFLLKYYGVDQDPRLHDPLHTVTTRDRFGIVMVHGEPWQIVDIGMRMLSPRELFRAQGFPDSYEIDAGLFADGQRRPLTKTAQVRMCGNSVCPPLAKALVAANCADLAAPAEEHAA